MPVHSIVRETYGSFSWLMREVGRDRQLSPDPSLWDHSDTNWIESIVQSGYHQFCYPPPVDARKAAANMEEDAEEKKDARRRKPHTWSFLHAMHTLTTKANKNLYEMPLDYLGVNGDLVIESGKGRIPSVPEAQLRALSAKDTASGVPEYAAIRSRHTTTEGQRYDILLHPTPKEEYNLTFRYAVAVPDLSEENPFPFGGRQHAETILASCLAVAEEREDGKQGEKYQKFMERLAASVHLDKQNEPTESTTWKSKPDSDGNTLQSLAGDHLGFGQNPGAWTEQQRQIVLQITREGVDRVLMSAPLPGRKDVHEWSFLTPMLTVNVKSGKYKYDLPKNFAGFSLLGGSPVTYKSGDNVIYPSIKVTGEHHIRNLLQQTIQATGRPVKAGHGLKEGSSGYEILFWPVPDDDYVLEVRCRVQVDPDMTSIPGSEAHFLTYLEAIRAAGDVYLKRRNNKHEERFKERLHASIVYDQQLKAPPTMGYDRDGSNRSSGDVYDDLHRFGSSQKAVGYNGNLYT